jgi:hypothetical protein
VRINQTGLPHESILHIWCVVYNNWQEQRTFLKGVIKMLRDKKGIPTTSENMDMVFKEAGYDDAKLNVTPFKKQGSSGTRVTFELADGTRGASNFNGSILPTEPRKRRALIRNLVASSRRVTASPQHG